MIFGLATGRVRKSRAMGTMARAPWSAIWCSPSWAVRAKANMKAPKPMLKAAKQAVMAPRDGRV